MVLFYSMITTKKGVNEMSRKCQLTGKGPMSGNNRSHALNATRRRWNVNLQKAVVMIDGVPTEVRASARALRTLKKNG